MRFTYFWFLFKKIEELLNLSKIMTQLLYIKVTKQNFGFRHYSIHSIYFSFITCYNSCLLFVLENIFLRSTSLENFSHAFKQKTNSVRKSTTRIQNRRVGK